MEFSVRHLLAAVIAHGVLFALLLGNFQSARRIVPPPVIEAVLLDPSRQDRKARKVESDRRQRQAAADRKKQELAERQIQEAKALAEKQAAETAAEQQRQKELKEREKAETLKKAKQEEADRLRKAAEAQQKKVQAAREKQLMDEAMREETRRALEQEAETRSDSQREARQSEWVTQIVSKIQRNWVRPLASPDKFGCLLRVQLLPGGQVIDARIVESCGNASLDDSVQKAVLRSDPLPTPEDPRIFQRTILINFVP